MEERRIETVPIDQLVPDPDQPRKTFSEASLLGMAGTLKSQQVQPLLVRRRGGQWVIVDGERRWRAAKLAGLTTIDVIVIDDTLDDGELLLWQLIANSGEELPPLEKADAVSRLMEKKFWTLAETADWLGESSPTLSKLLAVAASHPDIREAVKAGMSVSAAYELTRVDDPQLRRELMDEVIGGRLTRDKLASKIKRIQRGQSAGTNRSMARATVLLGEGRTVTVNGPGLSIDTFLEMLEYLVSKTKKARTQGLTLETFIRALRDQAG